MTRSPSLASVLKQALDTRLYGLRVSVPARVERYDPAKRLCDVKPLIRDSVSVGTEDERTESVPVISNVPVVFPGAGGFRLTFPIKRGDTVLLVFADRSLDKWLQDGREVDPVDVRSHHLSDAIAIPGLESFANAVEAHAENLVIGLDGGSEIHIKPNGEIHVGSENASDFVALATKVLDELNALRTAINSHTHAVSTTGSATAQAGTAAANPTAASPVGSVAAEKVKAD